MLALADWSGQGIYSKGPGNWLRCAPGGCHCNSQSVVAKIATISCAKFPGSDLPGTKFVQKLSQKSAALPCHARILQFRNVRTELGNCSEIRRRLSSIALL